MEEYIYTSVRMPRHLHEKWHELASDLGVSRNQVFSRLLEGAEVKSRPSVSVSLEKENTHSAQNLVGTSIAGVRAN